jgi:amidase
MVETWDCFSNRVTSPDQRFGSEDDVLALIGQFNPVTGPIWIEGAEPNDVLAIRIESIAVGVVAPEAVTMIVPGSGGLCGRYSILEPTTADTRICPITPDSVILPTNRGDLTLPLRPMIGTIGTAPRGAARPTLEFGPAYGGNIDCPEVRPGSTIYLPVNVPGGLLSIGDVHAAMGDGELTGTALETSADVILQVDLLRDPEHGPATCPWIETADSLGSIGCDFGAGVDHNMRVAAADLVRRLHDGFGLDLVEGYELVGAAARVRVNQCVDGGWSSVLVAIPKTVLPSAAG